MGQGRGGLTALVLDALTNAINETNSPVTKEQWMQGTMDNNPDLPEWLIKISFHYNLASLTCDGRVVKNNNDTFGIGAATPIPIPLPWQRKPRKSYLKASHPSKKDISTN